MTTVQRMRALERAHAAKRIGSDLRAEIRQLGPGLGAERAADAVLAGESSMKVYSLLLAVPKVGEMQARRLLRRAEWSPVCRVNDGMVSVRRRRLLAGLLRELGGRS